MDTYVFGEPDPKYDPHSYNNNVHWDDKNHRLLANGLFGYSEVDNGVDTLPGIKIRT